MTEGWTSVSLDEIEPITVAGSLQWRPLRRTLGVQAFGINAYVAANAGDDVVEEHTESTLQHEEVYVVLTGRATFQLGDEKLDARAGTVVFVRDPELKRHARAEEPGTSVLAVGGKVGRAVRAVGVGVVLRRRASPAERRLRRDGRRARGGARAASGPPGRALQPRLCGGQAGRVDDALAHLRRALELQPSMKEWADTDEDLAPLRERGLSWD